MTSATLDDTCSALGDDARRRILSALRDREPQTTNELARLFPTSRWAVMKHLAVLREAGLIQTMPQGRRRLHFFAQRGLDEVRAWLDGMT
jgi:DNA-binding transcriptional ArsR family regulator